MQAESDGLRTRACRLDTICSGQALERLQTFAVALHRVKLDAHELIQHEVLRRLEAGEALPELSNRAVVVRFFNAVLEDETTKGGQQALDERLRATRDACMPSFVPHPRLDGMANAFCYEGLKYVAQLKTQVARSFAARVGRLVVHRLTPDSDALEAMPSAKRKDLRLAIKHAAKRATWLTVNHGLDEPYATTVTGVLEDLGIPDIDRRVGNADKPLKYLMKAHPERFVPALWKINCELQAAGKACFKIVPMATDTTPGFFTLDQVMIKKMNLLDKAAKVRLNRRIKERQETVRPYSAELKALQKTRAAQEAVWKAEDAVRRHSRRDAYEVRRAVAGLVHTVEATAAEAAPSTSRPGKRKRPAAASYPAFAPTDVEAADDAAREVERDVIRSLFQSELNMILHHPEYRSLVDDAAHEKRDTFEAVFQVTNAIVRGAGRWAHTLATDGYSARLGIGTTHPKYATSSPSPVTPSTTPCSPGGATAMPTHGIFTVDTLSPALGDLKLTADEAAELEGVMAPSVYNAVLQRALDARGCAFVSMGGDPGKIELLRTADAGVAPRSRKAATPPPATEAARRAHPERQRQIGYT